MGIHSSKNPSGKVFCFGYGYVAQHLARELLPLGWQVEGTSRTAREGCCALERAADALKDTTHVLLSIPPDEHGDVVLRQYGETLPALEWVGYLSATSVYGDTHGGWVDESAAATPPTERGKRRVEAEQAWLELWRQRGVPVHIFRLAGIYGEGRNALADVLAGQARRIYKEGQVFSRIHVEDIVQVVRASMAQPKAGSIYNVADNLPAPAWEVVDYACHLLGVMAPPMLAFEEANLSPMARSFYEASRRVSNHKIREELGVSLRYPDYRRGLEALLAGEKANAAR